ncbi:hypothetical protein GCM10027610_128680 [Dactylosporangium cerinum]
MQAFGDGQDRGHRGVGSGQPQERVAVVAEAEPVADPVAHRRGLRRGEHVVAEDGDRDPVVAADDFGDDGPGRVGGVQERAADPAVDDELVAAARGEGLHGPQRAGEVERAGRPQDGGSGGAEFGHAPIFEQGYDKKAACLKGRGARRYQTMVPSPRTWDKPVIVRVMCYRPRQAS